MGVTLEAFDDHQIDRAQLRQDFHERRFRLVPQLMHEGPAPIGDDGDFAGAGLAVQPRILARPIDIEFVMRMLDGRDLEPAPHQNRNDFGQERRLAGSAPAGEANDAHRRGLG